MYSPEISAGSMRIASSKIIIVSEAADDTAEFAIARKHLTEADRIYFLGFDYAPQNIRRLFDFGTINGSRVKGFGTGVGLGSVEMNKVREQFGSWFKIEGHSIKNFFTHSAPLNE
jgi:hypothetical protein